MLQSEQKTLISICTIGQISPNIGYNPPTQYNKFTPFSPSLLHPRYANSRHIPTEAQNSPATSRDMAPQNTLIGRGLPIAGFELSRSCLQRYLICWNLLVNVQYMSQSRSRFCRMAPLTRSASLVDVREKWKADVRVRTSLASTQVRLQLERLSSDAMQQPYSERMARWQPYCATQFYCSWKLETYVLNIESLTYRYTYIAVL